MIQFSYRVRVGMALHSGGRNQCVLQLQRSTA